MALVHVEETVAAGERQAVGLPGRLHAQDLHGEVQIAHHAADQRQLLGVLLPEQRDVGAGEVQQLGDDGEHAVEVTGPGRAFQALAHRARGDPDLRFATGVDLVDGRREDHVGAGRAGHREIGVQGARVAVEVGGLPELERVDEDRDDDLAGRSDNRACGLYQGGVALVQSAHRHDDGTPGPLAFGGVPRQFGGGAEQRGGGCGHRDSSGPVPALPDAPEPSARTSSRSSASSGLSMPWESARSAVARAIAT